MGLKVEVGVYLDLEFCLEQFQALGHYSLLLARVWRLDFDNLKYQRKIRHFRLEEGNSHQRI